MFSVQQPDQSEADFIKEVSARVERLNHMLQTQGWQEFEAYVRGEMANAKNALAQATTGDMAMKAGTAFTVMERLVNLPRTQVEESIKLLHTPKT